MHVTVLHLSQWCTILGGCILQVPHRRKRTAMAVSARFSETITQASTYHPRRYTSPVLLLSSIRTYFLHLLLQGAIALLFGVANNVPHATPISRYFHVFALDVALASQMVRVLHDKIVFAEPIASFPRNLHTQRKDQRLINRGVLDHIPGHQKSSIITVCAKAINGGVAIRICSPTHAAEKLESRTRRSARQPNGQLRSSKGKGLGPFVFWALLYRVLAEGHACDCRLPGSDSVARAV